MKNKSLKVQMDSLDGHPVVSSEWIPLVANTPPLTVSAIRRCVIQMRQGWRVIEREIEIQAFEKWQHRPDPDETRILEKLADEITKRR